MFQPTVCPVAAAADRAQLEQLATHGRTPQKTALRARIVLMLVTGAKPTQVARALRVSRMRVRLWRQRYLATGVRAACCATPRVRGVTRRCRPNGSP